MRNFMVIAEPLEYLEEEGERRWQIEAQPAFDKAVELASKGDSVEVLIVIYEPLLDLTFKNRKESGEAQSGFEGSERDLLVKNEERKWQHYLEQYWEDVEFDFELHCHIAWGEDFFEIILERVEEQSSELIIKGGHRSETFFHTPTDWLLFRESPVPVLSVALQPENKSKSDHSIIVALDLLSKSGDKIWLNQQLVSQAEQLSSLISAPIHYCVAIETPNLIKDLDLFDEGAYVKKQRDLIDEKITELRLRTNVSIGSNQLHVHEGKAHQVINYFARRLHASCIVVGSMGNSGIRAKLVGNTAEKIVHYANRDVLVV